MLQARTLPEARLYLDLMAADLGRWELDVTLAERAGAWSLTGDLGVQRLEVVVWFATEAAAKEAGCRFGIGTSELIDVAQWWLVATTSARRLHAEVRAYDGRSAPAWHAIVASWEYAVDAAGEAVKFVPAEVGRPPESAIWSETGERLWRDHPDAFTRARLIGDRTSHLRHLDDFRRLHPRPPQPTG
jgi:hypothetical protein